MKIQTPKTTEELLERANAMTGRTIAELTEEVPEDFLSNKGWLGQLMELHLGTTAGNLSEPDFQALGIELKTIPVSRLGKPKESTFVCHIDLLNIAKQSWKTSDVFKKLNHVLWMPVEGEKDIPIPERKICAPILWQPTEEQEETLRGDWEELTDMIAMGQLEYITARHGDALQIRPKGANSKSLAMGVDEFGKKIKTLPRGFYLRAGFTGEILKM